MYISGQHEKKKWTGFSVPVFIVTTRNGTDWWVLTANISKENSTGSVEISHYFQPSSKMKPYMKLFLLNRKDGCSSEAEHGAQVPHHRVGRPHGHERTDSAVQRPVLPEDRGQHPDKQTHHCAELHADGVHAGDGVCFHGEYSSAFMCVLVAIYLSPSFSAST